MNFLRGRSSGGARFLQNPPSARWFVSGIYLYIINGPRLRRTSVIVQERVHVMTKKQRRVIPRLLLFESFTVCFESLKVLFFLNWLSLRLWERKTCWFI